MKIFPTLLTMHPGMLAKLSELHNHEMWLAGAAVRSLRPHEAAKGNAASAGWGGRKVVK